MSEVMPSAEARSKIGVQGASDYRPFGAPRATDFAKTTLGIPRVDYGGRKDIANTCNKALLSVKRRGVPMPVEIRVDASAFDPGSDWAAFYEPAPSGNVGTIVLNPNHPSWANPALVKDAGRRGEIATGDKHHLIMHELGELAQHFSVGVPAFDKGTPEYNALEDQFKPHSRMMRRLVSDRAAENHSEFVAEVFAARQLGRTDFDQGVLDLYTQMGGRKIRRFDP